MRDKLKILVVEDEGIIARWICEGIKGLGALPLQPVPKGLKAIEVALHEKPDLIFMDIRLAGPIDGIETARIIKEKINIPIVFMSGFATEFIIKNAQTVGYLDFFKKPVRIEQLEGIIHQVEWGE